MGLGISKKYTDDLLLAMRRPLKQYWGLRDIVHRVVADVVPLAKALRADKMTNAVSCQRASAQEQ
eukprot:SAG25_NODE_2071_length_1984_cov_1.335279_2_plen_65_part_00